MSASEPGRWSAPSRSWPDDMGPGTATVYSPAALAAASPVAESSKATLRHSLLQVERNAMMENHALAK